MILHQIHPKRFADDIDLSDLTTATRTEPARWVECEVHGAADCLLISLDSEPDADTQAAIRRRLVTADDADENRLRDLLALRNSVATPFEVMWLNTELAKYGE